MSQERKLISRTTGIIALIITVMLCGGLTAALIGYAVTRDKKDDVVETPPSGSPGTGIRIETASSGGSADTEGEAHLRISLSKGQQQAGVEESVPLATGEPLDDSEVNAIFDRLPALTSAPDDVEDFNLPDRLLPPPRTGEVIDEPFPPPPADATPPAVAEGPLEVLRYAPEGEIPIAPFLNVTFNQPMVPLTTIEELAAEDVPVRLTPELPGVWKWLGTKTLSFEYKSDEIDRFPKATQYRVHIPAGTKSAVGGILEQDVSWTFRTPPPVLVDYYPSDGPHSLEPLIYISFDQIINPDAVLSTIDVEVNGQRQSVRLASESDIEADEVVSRRVEYARDGYWLAFRSTAPFPADSSVWVTIGPGTPSSEGPLLTEEEQSFSFFTYAPLQITNHECGWYDGECPPLYPFYIYFNNPLDIEAFDESMLSVDPEIQGAAVSVGGRSITIQGITQGRTKYDVTVDGSIKDIFGQTMGRDETVRFKVGSAPPSLVGPDQLLVTLDPSADKKVFTVYSINYSKLRVRAYDVEPSDWPAFKDFLQEYYRNEDPPDPPGREIYNQNIKLDYEDDALTETAIDLEEIISDDFGHAVVIIDAPPRLFPDKKRYHDVIAWVQSTKIGLDAFVDHSEMVVWATALDDGKPLYGVEIEAEPAGSSVKTGEDGLAQFALTNSGASLLVARKDGDMAILPRSTSYWGDDVWSKRPIYDELRWYIFDDRQMYKPGEEVHVKGWMRRIGGLQGGDVGLLGDDATNVRYQVIGPQGNDITEGETSVNALGGFDFVFTLPENANLGYATIRLIAEGNLRGLNSYETGHSFQIQEFRRPEFEVTARNESVGPYFVGDHAVVAVEAKYFAGGPLPNADTTWYVTSTPSNYSPPNWPEFNFGIWRPWWFFFEEAYYSDPYVEYEDESIKTFEGITDASGTHYLRLDFEEANKPRPFSVFAEATVMDVNRQAWSDATTMLVHPAEYYVGIRSEKTFVQQGIPLEIEAIVTDIDGNAVAGQTIQMTAGRLEWKYEDGHWDEVEVDVQDCSIESAAEAVTCSFDTSSGGTYRITATVTDDLGRLNKSEFQRWVSGGKQPPARNVEQETVSLIPDKEIYKPGDMAQVLVQSPFSPAEGLLTVSRNGILYTERFLMAEDSTTLDIPIAEEHIPNLNIQVDLVGAAPRTGDDGEIIEGLPERPAYATGALNLGITLFNRSLSVQIDPEESALEPGGETIVNVTATDANGQPVSNAELAVVVVDEAILALTNYQLADPLYVFYTDRPSMVSSQYGRASIVLANPELLAEQVEEGISNDLAAGSRAQGDAMMEAPVEEAEMAFAPSPTSEQKAEEPGSQAIKVRSDFNPLATFAPEVRTDANGQARVEVQVPDNLTRYRIMVVAVAGDKQFGSAESNLVARLPLMVRPSAPRFLNFGDQFQLPIVLQNQTDDVMEVEVVVQASNVELTGEQGLRVQVPANDRIEVRFPVTTLSPGTARFQIAAVSGDYADAAVVDLPVYTPATTEAFATYGVVDEGAILQPVAAPSNVFPQFGGLEINTSSTALQALTDAVLYLTAYPYECTEQLASRILAIAALRDVLDAFNAEGLPSPEELEKAVERDIETLSNLQNYDGGFPVWTRGKDSIPFHTIHVAHALQMAKNKGFSVPADMQESVLWYLTDIEEFYPHWYGQRTRWSLSAYALYVRMLMGDRDTAKAGALYHEAGLDGLSLEGAAWIWRVLNDDPSYRTEVDEIKRHIENRAVETPGAANFTTSYGEEAYLLLHSDRRTDAIILDALISGDPASDLIPKVVNGLLAHRTKGRWANTQENVFILLALDRYFNTFETETPDFLARMWLGETFAGEHEFVGRTTERVQTIVPMAYLVDESEEGTDTYDLILSKDGVGRLYYRLGMSYSPTDLELDPLDMGFVVSRSYEALDDPEDVYQDEDGVWHIKAGARVLVRLTMVADNRRYHVALVDPLPAGLEIVNPALAVSGDIPQDPGETLTNYGWWWWGPWYDHQNMRDERAEAFTTLLWDGVHNYSYYARATTPGEFVVPPAKAEEMYSPEVFGRSSSDFVIIE